MIWITGIIAAYLLGSIPTGYLIGRARGIDIRQHGSGNIGATNLGRVLGRRLGLLCFALDALKGAVPVLVIGALAGVLGQRPSELTQAQMWLWMAVAAAPVVGHMFSIFLRFRGGKGVATGCGSMLAMWPLLTFPAVVALVVWYATLRLIKYVSIASILAAASVPLAYALWIMLSDDGQRLGDTLDRLIHASPPFIGTAIIALLVAYQHRGNIARIRRGEEPRAGER